MLNAVSIEFRYQQSPLGPTSSDIDYCPIRRPTSYVKHSPPDVRKCPPCSIKSAEWPNDFEMPTTRYLTAISHSVSKLAVNISSRCLKSPPVNVSQSICDNCQRISSAEFTLRLYAAKSNKQDNANWPSEICIVPRIRQNQEIGWARCTIQEVGACVKASSEKTRPIDTIY